MKSDQEVILKRPAANGVDGSRGVTGSRPRAIGKARIGATAFALRGTWLRE